MPTQCRGHKGTAKMEMPQGVPPTGVGAPSTPSAKQKTESDPLVPPWPGDILVSTSGANAPESGLRCSSSAPGMGGGPTRWPFPTQCPSLSSQRGAGAAANCKSFLRAPHCSAKFTGTNVSRNKFHRRARAITGCLGPSPPTPSPEAPAGSGRAQRTGWSGAGKTDAGCHLRGQTPAPSNRPPCAFRL